MCQVRAPYRKCVSLTAGRALSCRDATGDAVLPGSWSEESTGACGHELGLRDRYWGIGSLGNPARMACRSAVEDSASRQMSCTLIEWRRRPSSLT
jgi:hypothetical protein